MAWCNGRWVWTGQAPRRRRHRAMRPRGMRYLYLVIPQKCGIPDQFRQYEPKDFEPQDDRIWLDRYWMKVLVADDLDWGGRSVVIKSAWRRCKRCGAMLLQIATDAWWRGEHKPCEACVAQKAKVT